MIQATTKCRSTLNRIHDIVITYSQMYRADKYSRHNSIIWPVLLNCSVLIYDLSGCEFEFRGCHLSDNRG